MEGMVRVPPVGSRLPRPIDTLLTKKPAGLIVLGGGATKAVVEYKPPDKLKTDSQIQAAIDQELAVAVALCRLLLIVTSGARSIWINALNGERVLATDGSTLRFVVDAKAIGNGNVAADELERLLEAADASLTATHSAISAPFVLDPSMVASTIWQKIWVQTGKGPEKCLYNVVELFVFKFLSDLGVLKAHNGFREARFHSTKLRIGTTGEWADGGHTKKGLN